jgi:hypothetical protein
MKNSVVWWKFAVVLLLVLGWGGTAWAYRTLNQIQHEVYKEPSALVEEDLRALSQRGDLGAKIELANLLSLGNAADAKEALVLYKDAFADGRGQIVAIGALARLLKQNPRMRLFHSDYMKQALRQYPHKQDPRTVNATLEVFLTYPEFFETSEVTTLIDLYQQSCLIFCRPQLYKAVLAERDGDRETAEYMYRKAIWLDSRAIVLYYDFMGEKEQDELFPIFAQNLADQKGRLPVETVHNIATLLDTIYSTQAGLLTIENKKRRKTIDLMVEGPAKEKALDELETLQREQSKIQHENNLVVRTWLDNAVEREWLPAMVTKVSYMGTWAGEYSGEEALMLTDRIAETAPQQAKALHASIYQESTWHLTLAPYKSHEIIKELITEKFREGQLMLAHLYSRGGLGESDQEKALEIFRQQARAGAPGAFFSIALIYYRGESWCKDIVEAYAHANAARMLGDFRSRGILKRFIQDMTENQLQQALQRSQELLEKYQL